MCLVFNELGDYNEEPILEKRSFVLTILGSCNESIVEQLVLILTDADGLQWFTDFEKMGLVLSEVGECNEEPVLQKKIELDLNYIGYL